MKAVEQYFQVVLFIVFDNFAKGNSNFFFSFELSPLGSERLIKPGYEIANFRSNINCSKSYRARSLKPDMYIEKGLYFCATLKGIIRTFQTRAVIFANAI